VIEPSLELQKAIRAHLIGLRAVTDLVTPDHIRAGSTRPDKSPAIIIGDGVTQFLGYAAGSQYVARVFIDLHVWAIENGADVAKTIGGVLAAALRDPPATDGFAIDEWALTRIVWPRDPNPELGHGVLSVEAAVRWSI
jgi:hypothetical protein